MSKFQSTIPKPVTRKPDTTNLAGGSAFQQDAELELASLVSTSLVQDQYYRSAEDGLERLRELIGQVDPYFAAQAAVYVRQNDGLRSISHALAGELAHSVKGEAWTKDFFNAVVRRPDDITETLAYYMGRYGKPVPNSIKKGFGKAFGKFDEYALAKYRGENNNLSLVDAVNIIHPRPTAKNAEALNKLVNGTLRSTGTWESKVSAAGSDQEKKAEAWSDLVLSGKIGYMALLKNLRNIVALDEPKVTNAALGLLIDPDRIHKSLVLPFRFVIAARELSAYPKVVAAISKALDISLDNIPDLGENILIAIDHSGSMHRPAAGNEQFSRQAIGDIFGAALLKKCGADVIAFGDYAGPIEGILNPADSTLTIAERIGGTYYGYGTNFQSIIDYSFRKPYDTIVIFSDMQAWHGTTPIIAKGTDVFAFDLAGHGTSQFAQNKVHQLSGFSDQSISLIAKLKEDPRALVTRIKAVTF